MVSLHFTVSSQKRGKERLHVSVGYMQPLFVNFIQKIIWQQIYLHCWILFSVTSNFTQNQTLSHQFSASQRTGRRADKNDVTDSRGLGPLSPDADEMEAVMKKVRCEEEQCMWLEQWKINNCFLSSFKWDDWHFDTLDESNWKSLLMTDIPASAVVTRFQISPHENDVCWYHFRVADPRLISLMMNACPSVSGVLWRGNLSDSLVRWVNFGWTEEMPLRSGVVHDVASS